MPGPRVKLSRHYYNIGTCTQPEPGVIPTFFEVALNSNIGGLLLTLKQNNKLKKLIN